jgi:VanZ family protein
MSGKFWYTVLAGYVSVLGFLSLNPWIRPTSTDSIFSPDKFDHAIAYGGLVIIVFFCFARLKNRYINSASSAWIAAWLVAVLIGILIEIAQFCTFKKSICQ